MNKEAKADVDYSLGKPNAHCGMCRYYHDHVCSLVAGRIEPQMWCELFTKKEKANALDSKRRQPQDEEGQEPKS